MPRAFTESIVEDAALEWLEGMGYSIAHGPDIAHDGESPERPMTGKSKRFFLAEGTPLDSISAEIRVGYAERIAGRAV